jgi:hypothetical protein
MRQGIFWATNALIVVWTGFLFFSCALCDGHCNGLMVFLTVLAWSAISVPLGIFAWVVRTS